MLVEISKITDVLRSPIFVHDLMIVTSRKNRNTLAFKDLELVWDTKEKDYNANIFETEILTAHLKTYNLQGKIAYRHANYLNYHFELLDAINKISIWKTVDNENEEVLYHIFNLEKKVFIKENISSKIPRLTLDGKYFVCRFNDAEISLFNFFDQNEIWNQDLSSITAYSDYDGSHSGEIKKLYLHDNKLIITSGDSVLSINADNGEINWRVRHEDFQPLTLHIVDDSAYLCKGTFFSAIDLKKGEKFLETNILRPFDNNHTWQNAKYAMVGSDMTWHDGNFYFTGKHNNEYYFAKLDPVTGQIRDFQMLPEIHFNTYPPQFHDGKMFLLDSSIS